MSNSGANSPNPSNNGNNTTTTTTNTSTYVSTGNTVLNTLSTSINFPSSIIVNFTLNETIDVSGAAVITNQQGTTANGTEVTHTTFHTLSTAMLDLTLTEDLSGAVLSYYDDGVDQTSETNVVLNQIKDYAAKINCSDFQGKGTIEDYSNLFEAASKIANDTKQMQLAVDVEGFNEFGQAADDLSRLFNSFIVKLQTVSIIDDLNFLKSISAALAKIWNLSETFGKFKETILATSSVEMPKSAHDATLLVQSVMNEVNCAMGYINHFVSPSSNAPVNAALSPLEQNVISKAVSAIDNWSVLCDQGVTIAMSNNPDMAFISTANNNLKSKSQFLRFNTSTLRGKLLKFNISP